MADRKSEAEKEAPKEQKAPPKKGTGNSVPFNKNITIFTNRPLPEYDQGPIKAFHAEGKGKIPKELIAFMCQKELIPRWHAAAMYTRILNPNIATLIATGPKFIPSEGVEKFVIIYQNNWGKRLLPEQDKLAYGLKQDLIMEHFLPTIVHVLQDFNDKGFVHGGVRVDNLFNAGNNNLKNFILGDSLTTPPSYLQPSYYEPIERSMANPIGRGLGHFVDDLYSLGVLLTIMLRSHDPLEKMTEEQIIEEKIEKGSYAALTGKDRFTGPILELLRGVLHDSKSQRWNIDNVSQWMDGQRLNPKQTLKRKKASRVFHLDGHRYTRPEILASDLYKYKESLVQSVEDEKLELWVKRSLEDTEKLELLEQSLATAGDAGMNDGYAERLCSRVSIALDPSAPIRYKNIAFLPDGFGMALAEAYAQKKDLNVYAEVLDQNLVMFWLNAQNDKTIDYGSISNRFESCRSILRNRGYGFGLERCLYFLNSASPCMSSRLEKFYVKTPEEMVLAFEKLCKDKEISTDLLLDRHSVAFLSVKDSRILDAYLIELNAKEKYKNILANVWAISNIQKRYEMPPLPNIADHVVKIMGPVLERFHDRDLRNRMKKEFDKIKRSGDLSRVSSILENPEIIETDSKMFFRSMGQFRKMEKEKLKLENRLERKGEMGGNLGRTTAAIISTLIGGLGIMTLALLELVEAGVF